jgi:hypothetical protein
MQTARRRYLLFNNYTDKKEIQISLIYKKNRKGAVAKSYMNNGICALPFHIYDFATDPI